MVCLPLRRVGETKAGSAPMTPEGKSVFQGMCQMIVLPTKGDVMLADAGLSSSGKTFKLLESPKAQGTVGLDNAPSA